MRTLILLLMMTGVLVSGASAAASAVESTPGARVENPAYPSPKVVFDFYFARPDEINAGLFWIRSLIQPLMDAPYNEAPEMMKIVVVIHGTEIVTLAKKNEAKYQEAVERMRYYHDLGVQFHVCGLALHDYDYTPAEMQPFVTIVPSAMADLVGLQQQGYALIEPKILGKQLSIHDIR
ncbi:DsrE family protein [Halothiobacillus sp. DCM-1]|uniref:DsrE family protein n=1 Tax=Halothiobacillus sp. DCM-1 TaxID=3112558 RepID=UPI003250197E